MFGRTKTTSELPATPSTTSGSPETVAGAADGEAGKGSGKGRPTPKRRQAEQANRRPLIGSSATVRATQALDKASTRQERKAAKAARRAAMREARDRQRQALITGDDAHLPARDRGPVRRFVRDYVDARRSAGEYLLPAALVVWLVGISVPPVRLVTFALLYVLVVLVIFDCGRVRGQLRRELQARFGDKATKSDANYGMMRTLQMRRLRLPKPRVARGQRPS